MAYRAADIGALAEREFGVRDSLSGMRKLLHGLGLSWLQPRPSHPASDAEAQAEFTKLPRMVAEVAAGHPEATSIELWFQDEMRVGQKGTLIRLWGRRGQRLQAKRDLGFGYAYLFGAVCPARGSGAGKIEPSSFAKGSDVDDHPFVGVYGETHVIARLESLQQCRGSDHEAHFHHRRHEVLDLLVGKD